MEKSIYLIAFALIEQSGKRIMPIGGKALTPKNKEKPQPSEESKAMLLDLLLRVYQRSSEDYLKKINSENSLFLMEMEMEVMQEKLPIIKAKWLTDGNNKELLKNLIQNSLKIWSATYEKYVGLKLIDVS